MGNRRIWGGVVKVCEEGLGFFFGNGVVVVRVVK
jgi:hypothetical protein